MSQPSFDFEWDDPAADEPGNSTYSVTELAEAINSQLRRGFTDGVWVRGEIDGFRQSGPHRYFSLVEHTVSDDGRSGKAVLNVSLFAPMLARLTPILRKNRLDLANGMKVRVFGALDYFAPTGRLGLKMAGIDPRFTLGELSQARDQIVRRLVASGLLDANAQLDLPAAPLRVGVVTSRGSAAWHDFHDELVRSGFGFQVTVCHTKVQGDGAADSVAAAIRTLARRPGLDCLVVIRGGGARNELATFDAESIAVAIATSPVPVVTGLGHEIDRSVADEVAHTVAKTPTAAAGVLIDAVAGYQAATEARFAAITQRAERSIHAIEVALAERARRVAHHTHAAVQRADDRLDARRDRLVAAPSRTLRQHDQHLTAAAALLVRRPPAVLGREGERLDGVAARVRLLDPVNVLRRGWSITRDADGNVVRSVADAPPGTALVTQVADGQVTSTVSSTVVA
ncbi:MAG TPA: exodeoxyribonuclease VII large subunit [Ilumatobacter sp.]|nr:exodeoxyribonuclease VII large subunit [Ilumatobacter sp.]